MATALFDDFYYYAVSAEGLLEHGFPSFDGQSATNGFHPLWFGVIATLRAMLGHSPTFLYGVLGLVSGLMVVLTDRLTRVGDRLGASPLVAGVLAVLVTGFATLYSLGGLEVALWLPLWAEHLRRSLARPLSQASKGEPLTQGLLGAVLGLTRLDGMLYVLIWLGLSAWRAPKKAAWISLGLLPWGLWAVANTLAFGHLVPVSGRAKGLAGLALPDGAHLAELATFDDTGGLVLFSGLGLGLLALASLIWQRRLQPAVLASLIFAPLFFAWYALSSDWPLWFWYAYPALAAAALGGMVLATRDRGPLVRVPAGVCLGLVSLWLVIYAALHAWHPVPPQDYLAWAIAQEVRAFEAQHPGRYAMGDLAGTTAWVVDSPIVQLEGLMADGALIEDIRAQRPLAEVLEERGVDWYVGEPISEEGGCHGFVEPRMAGPRSPVMAMESCEPVAHAFEVQGRRWVILSMGSEIPED